VLHSKGPRGENLGEQFLQEELSQVSAEFRGLENVLEAGDVPAEMAFCFANGNTARQRELDTGLIERGYAADFVLMDQAQHAPGGNILESMQLGNLPGVGMTIIDGVVTSQRSRNTPPATRLPELLG